jgi:hypothetical protein
MIKQTEKEKSSPLETEPIKPCVYGKDILAACPVRAAFGPPDPMKKYKMPVSSELDDVKAMIDMGMDALNSDPNLMRILVAFCSECPHLDMWHSQRLYDLQKRGKIE